MTSAWLVNIALRTTSNFPQVANGIVKNSQAINAATAATQKNINSLGTSIGKTLKMSFDIAGVAALAFTAIGVKGAANLQDAMLQTAIATGNVGKTLDATMAKMQPFHQLALKMSMSTAQSVTDSMSLLSVMASSGIPANQLAKVAMPIAQYADIQYLDPRWHTPFQQSATMAVKLAHDLQLFEPAQLTAGLNKMYKVGEASPDNIAKLQTQIKYFAATALKDLPSTSVTPAWSGIIDMAALLDRMSLAQGRGGTGINMFMRNVVAPSGKKMANAQDLLGVSAYHDEATGAIDFFGLLKHLNDDYQAAKQSKTVGDFQREFANAFSTNAGQVIGTLATPGALEQMRRIKYAQDHMPSLQEAQVVLMESLNNQTKLLYTNFKTLATEIGLHLLPPLTAIVTPLAAGTGNAALFMNQHPSAARATAFGLGLMSLWGVKTLASLGLNAVGIGAHLAENGGARVGVYAGHFGRIARGATGAANAIDGGWNIIGDSIATIFDRAGFRNFASSVGDLGSLLRAWGPRAGTMLSTGAGRAALGGAAGRVGSRAIPGLGELLLAWDAISGFFTHAADLDRLSGKLAAWWEVKGTPAVRSALYNFFNSVQSGFVLGLQGIWATIGPLFDDLAHGNLLGFEAQAAVLAKRAHDWINEQQYLNDHIRQVAKAKAEGEYQYQDVKAQRHVTASGKYRAGTIDPLDTPQHVSLVVAPVFQYHAAPGEDDASAKRRAFRMQKSAAEKVASIITSAMRTANVMVAEGLDATIASQFETAFLAK